MPPYVWFLIAGLLLISMALVISLLKHLPLSSSMVYLFVGILVGPFVLNWLHAPPLDHAVLLEHLTEIAVIISLFTAGLKLRLPLSDKRWRGAFLLAFVSMTITVALLACVGYNLLNLPWGAAIILAAILAPTDPVLASDVLVQNHLDRDRLRFALTGEAGLNDGAAFPFIMLGLGLLGLHDLGDFALRWVAIDLLWAVVGGLLIGALLGLAVGWLVTRRRARNSQPELHDFLTLGLIAISYGLALVLHAYGFLAVFAAGVALRQFEIYHTGQLDDRRLKKIEKDPERRSLRHHSFHLTNDLLTFNEQIERMAEVTVVTLLGALLWHIEFPGGSTLLFITILFLLIRPIAVLTGLAGSPFRRPLCGYAAWFGIRGVGSLYYLFFVINKGVQPEIATVLLQVVFTTVTISIVVHGTSVTPLMAMYHRRHARAA